MAVPARRRDPSSWRPTDQTSNSSVTAPARLLPAPKARTYGSETTTLKVIAGRGAMCR